MVLEAIFSASSEHKSGSHIASRTPKGEDFPYGSPILPPSLPHLSSLPLLLPRFSLPGDQVHSVPVAPLPIIQGCTLVSRPFYALVSSPVRPRLFPSLSPRLQVGLSLRQSRGVTNPL